MSLESSYNKRTFDFLLRLRSHYATGTWFHSGNASKVLHPHNGRENATLTSHFGFVLKENSDKEIMWWLLRLQFFSISSVLKMFSVHTKTKDGLVWTVRLYVEIKLRFQICMLLMMWSESAQRNKLLEYLAGEFGFAISCFSWKVYYI